jgi:hypothetical protein
MSRFNAGLARAVWILALVPVQFHAQNSATGTREASVRQVTGSFEVKVAPQKPDNPQAEAAGLGRMSLDKQFHGALEATSQGEMLSVLDRDRGSGGYVAMERVTGKLDGKSGSFVLQHNATMNRGTPDLNIIVVPDSGTGELTGISGSMKIRIESGKHFYDFDYTIEPAH